MRGGRQLVNPREENAGPRQLVNPREENAGPRRLVKPVRERYFRARVRSQKKMNVRMSSGGQAEHIASSKQAEISTRGTIDCDLFSPGDFAVPQ